MCRIGERQWSGNASYHGVKSEISLFTIQKVIYLQGFDFIVEGKQLKTVIVLEYDYPKEEQVEK